MKCRLRLTNVQQQKLFCAGLFLPAWCLFSYSEMKSFLEQRLFVYYITNIKRL